MMLYDPKWEVETKAKPFTPTHVVGWLKTKQADEEYCYGETGHCLVAQYLKSMGHKRIVVGGTTMGYGRRENVPLPGWLNELALGFPRTFGGALERARALL